MKKAAELESPAASSVGSHHSKQTRMLHVFALGRSLNRFEAAAIGDSCLNSTVSRLSSQYGLNFRRAWETVPNRFGTLTRCLRYSLVCESKERARALLSMAA